MEGVQETNFPVRHDMNPVATLEFPGSRVSTRILVEEAEVELQDFSENVLDALISLTLSDSGFDSTRAVQRSL